MYNITHLEPVDYLVIGHIARDITKEGVRLGGTATYAALTAQALGLRVGVVTSWGAEIPLEKLQYIPIINDPAESSTTFENTETPDGRVQVVHHIANPIAPHMIPEVWRNSPIVHLAPILQEVEPYLVRIFPNSFIGLTPQGWMRSWDRKGNIRSSEWPEASFMLNRTEAAVISLEDVDGDESRINELIVACPVFVITEGSKGSRLYWHGDVRRFRPSTIYEGDSTGAGDIFATAFFIRLNKTRDPWESARFATELAAISVTRDGLDGVPKPEEVEAASVEVL
ncbi:MAG: PfkB family carbohydrate kinase [Anaerolineales bacterium]|jgi:sugar/nucleoside kinase (ribokinase family)